MPNHTPAPLATLATSDLRAQVLVDVADLATLAFENAALLTARDGLYAETSATVSACDFTILRLEAEVAALRETARQSDIAILALNEARNRADSEAFAATSELGALRKRCETADEDTALMVETHGYAIRRIGGLLAAAVDGPGAASAPYEKFLIALLTAARQPAAS